VSALLAYPPVAGQSAL